MQKSSQSCDDVQNILRIVNRLIAIPASLYLTPNTQNTRGHGCKFRVPAGCVDAFNYSFFPTPTIRIWNQLLPAAVVMFPSIEAFKSRLIGISAIQTSIQRHSSCFYLANLRLQHVFICMWNFDLSVASSTSCTSAMHDITQLRGVCIIGRDILSICYDFTTVASFRSSLWSPALIIISA